MSTSHSIKTIHHCRILFPAHNFETKKIFPLPLHSITRYHDHSRDDPFKPSLHSAFGLPPVSRRSYDSNPPAPMIACTYLPDTDKLSAISTFLHASPVAQSLTTSLHNFSTYNTSFKSTKSTIVTNTQDVWNQDCCYKGGLPW